MQHSNLKTPQWFAKGIIQCESPQETEIQTTSLQLGNSPETGSSNQG